MNNNVLQISIKQNPQLMQNINSKIHTALETCGLQAEANAKLNITDTTRSGVNLIGYEKDNSRVDTGRMRNSVTHTVSGNTVYIGSPLEYAVYNELGTGIYASQAGGRQSPWGYYDSKGAFHITRGMKPIHFLRNAIADHVSEYKEILETYLK